MTAAFWTADPWTWLLLGIIAAALLSRWVLDVTAYTPPGQSLWPRISFAWAAARPCPPLRLVRTEEYGYVPLEALSGNWDLSAGSALLPGGHRADDGSEAA